MRTPNTIEAMKITVQALSLGLTMLPSRHPADPPVYVDSQGREYPWEMLLHDYNSQLEDVPKKPSGSTVQLSIWSMNEKQSA